MTTTIEPRELEFEGEDKYERVSKYLDRFSMYHEGYVTDYFDTRLGGGLVRLHDLTLKMSREGRHKVRHLVGKIIIFGNVNEQIVRDLEKIIQS